jgi:hypothetical protein
MHFNGDNILCWVLILKTESMVDVYRRFGACVQHVAFLVGLLFDLEDGGSELVWNTKYWQPDYTAEQGPAHTPS